MGGCHFPDDLPWSNKCQYTVFIGTLESSTDEVKSSVFTTGGSFFHACLASSESGNIDNAGPFIGSPHLVAHSRSTKLAFVTDWRTLAQELPFPALDLVNKVSFIELSSIIPDCLNTSAIHGAIYPAGALNHGLNDLPTTLLICSQA
tara:strand:+ start:139 stop:579 length:441 start_codon:yes stop_codon:yes gene_type:complete